MYGAWGNVPEEGKLQILFLILMLETATEAKKPHYMRVSTPKHVRQHMRVGMPCSAADQLMHFCAGGCARQN